MVPAADNKAKTSLACGVIPLQRDLPIADLPQALLEDIGRELETYLIPIVVPDTAAKVPAFKVLGSGTLVTADGRHFILTAAHVWEAGRHWNNLYTILTRYPSISKIPRNVIAPREVYRTGEWGPDLAILEIVYPYVSMIEAYKSFLNLERQRENFPKHPVPTGEALCAVVGMVAAFSNPQFDHERRTSTLNAVGRTFFSLAQETHERENWDYVDVGAQMSLADVPKSFGGVSGGGLWIVNIKNTDASLTWDRKRHFRGVAFWQTEIKEDRSTIRCHGPKSIYDCAWSAWEFPTGEQPRAKKLPRN